MLLSRVPVIGVRFSSNRTNRYPIGIDLTKQEMNDV